MRRCLLWAAIVAAILIPGILFWVGVLEIPLEAARTIHVTFNYAESVVWFVAGVFVVWKTRRSNPIARRIGWIAAVAYGAFGVSDLVETRTGAWYDPWWLFAWKAACVVCLVACLVLYRRAQRKTVKTHGD